jgi:hypothetical protein
MNLKRIIREELENPLAWINDIKPALNKDQNWIVVNDVNPNSIEESIKIQKYLFNLGYKWFSSELINDTIYSIHHFPNKGLRGDLTYYNNKENERNLVDKEIERNNNVYYWSQIKPKLNESDELDWMDDSNIDVLQVGNIFKDNTSEKGPYFIIRKIIGDTAYIEGVEEKKWKNHFYLETLMEMLDRGEIVYMGERLPINILRDLYPSYFN